MFVCEMPSSLSCVCANMNRVHSPKREIENRCTYVKIIICPGAAKSVYYYTQDVCGVGHPRF